MNAEQSYIPLYNRRYCMTKAMLSNDADTISSVWLSNDLFIRMSKMSIFF